MVFSLYQIFKSFFIPSSPVIYLTIFILSSFRLIYLIFNKKKFIIYKEIGNLLTLFYLLCLFHVVTSKSLNLYRGSNFIPFKEINRYTKLSRLYFKNVIGNIILFIPYGYLISKFLKTKKFFINLVMVFIASLAIEFTQFTIGRVFDIDDIFLNIIGGLIGYLIYLIFSYLSQVIPKSTKKELVLNIVSIIVLFFFIIFILSMYL